MDFVFTKPSLLCCKNVYKPEINSYQSLFLKGFVLFCLCKLHYVLFFMYIEYINHSVHLPMVFLYNSCVHSSLPF